MRLAPYLLFDFMCRGSSTAVLCAGFVHFRRVANIVKLLLDSARESFGS